MSPWFPKIREAILDVLFPPQCAICERLSPDARDSFLCARCADMIPLETSLFCGECRGRLPLRGPLKDLKSACHPQSPYVLGAACRYEYAPVRSLVWRLKYRHKPALAKPLAALLIRYVKSLNLAMGDSCVAAPIPLSVRRLRERDYNHAEEIAKDFAVALHLPLVPALRKTKDTAPQAELEDWNARKINLAACFAVIDPATIKGKLILLVDDISTSGATLAEASRVLKESGAKKIIGLVVAKAG